jgi:hypothetical protein
VNGSRAMRFTGTRKVFRFSETLRAPELSKTHALTRDGVE